MNITDEVFGQVKWCDVGGWMVEPTKHQTVIFSLIITKLSQCRDWPTFCPYSSPSDSVFGSKPQECYGFLSKRALSLSLPLFLSQWTTCLEGVFFRGGLCLFRKQLVGCRIRAGYTVSSLPRLYGPCSGPKWSTIYSWRRRPVFGEAWFQI